MNKSKCRACGAEIAWIKTTAGKNMPCDADMMMYWQKEKGSRRIVTPNGEVLACEYEGEHGKATGMGYVPHWATCPEADNFKKGGAKN